MSEVTWLRGSGGALMSFAGDLPPFIAAQVAKGDLTRVALPDPPEVLPLPAPESVAAPGPWEEILPRPAADATKAAWEAWAVSQGMSASKAHRTPKAQLARQYAALRAVG